MSKVTITKKARGLNVLDSGYILENIDSIIEELEDEGETKAVRIIDAARGILERHFFGNQDVTPSQLAELIEDYGRLRYSNKEILDVLEYDLFGAL